VLLFSSFGCWRRKFNHDDANEDATDTARYAEIVSRHIRVPVNRLFNIDPGREEVLSDIEEIFPTISSSLNPRIPPFLAELHQYMRSQASNVTAIPVRVENPKTWPTIGSDIDIWWNGPQGVAILESTLQHYPESPSWMKEHLVKPRGSLQAPLLVVSSYPTFTIELSAWDTGDDVSNRSMSDLNRKLGFAGPNLRTCDLLHIDIVPRRIARTKIPHLTKVGHGHRVHLR
jgi:hypothetical protein